MGTPVVVVPRKMAVLLSHTAPGTATGRRRTSQRGGGSLPGPRWGHQCAGCRDRGVHNRQARLTCPAAAGPRGCSGGACDTASITAQVPVRQGGDTAGGAAHTRRGTGHRDSAGGGPRSSSGPSGGPRSSSGSNGGPAGRRPRGGSRPKKGSRGPQRGGGTRGCATGGRRTRGGRR